MPVSATRAMRATGSTARRHWPELPRLRRRVRRGRPGSGRQCPCPWRLPLPLTSARERTGSAGRARAGRRGCGRGRGWGVYGTHAAAVPESPQTQVLPDSLARLFDFCRLWGVAEGYARCAWSGRKRKCWPENRRRVSVTYEASYRPRARRRRGAGGVRRRVAGLRAGVFELDADGLAVVGWCERGDESGDLRLVPVTLPAPEPDETSRSWRVRRSRRRSGRGSGRSNGSASPAPTRTSTPAGCSPTCTSRPPVMPPDARGTCEPFSGPLTAMGVSTAT